MSSAAGLDAHLVVQRGGGFRLELPLHIEPGRTVALLGPNGAGKSTAVAALAGMVALDEGRIVLDGRVLDDPSSATFLPPERRRLGIVFQDYVLFPHLSALENVAFGPAARGLARRDAHERAARWLERLDLAELASQRPAELSGGQAQRVALARALATDPAMLLLDEPLAALDVTTRAQLRRTLSTHLSTFPGPRLLITHEPTDAFLLADDIRILEDGRLVQVGTADQIRRHPRTPYVADLAGINLVGGTARHGEITTEDGSVIHTAETSVEGPVLVTIHPRVIALHPDQPHGSARNTWPTVVTAVEPLGDRVRVVLGPPVPLTAEITPGAASELALAPGAATWIAIKATEITVVPA